MSKQDRERETRYGMYKRDVPSCRGSDAKRTWKKVAIMIF
jgi:hypothetical protein